jgi:hypothetical protein
MTGGICAGTDCMVSSSTDLSDSPQTFLAWMWNWYADYLSSALNSKLFSVISEICLINSVF